MVQGNDQFEDYLTRGRHANPDLHRFGDAFLIPDTPTASLPGDSGDPGESDIPARSDHRHEREAASAEDPTPVGMVNMFAGDTPPTGWLECNGAAISRSTYVDLFNRIGVKFGNGDGTTTFNLPDFRDRFPMGKSTLTPAGSTGGASAVLHNHSGVTSGPSSTTAVQSGAGATVASDVHNHTVSSQAISTVPPYQAIMFIIKAEV